MTDNTYPADAQQPTSPTGQEYYPADQYANNQAYPSYGMDAGMGYGDVTISSSISNVSAYVGNLHPSTTREDLQSLFASCGNIRRIAVPVHPTGQIKGCGYVEFEDPEGLQLALQLHNTTLNGHTIDVYAKRDTVRDTRGMFRGRGRGYPMMNPYGRGYGMVSPYGRPMMMPYGGYGGYGSGYMGGRGMGQGYPGYPAPSYGREGIQPQGYPGMPYGYPPAGAGASDVHGNPNSEEGTGHAETVEY